MDKNKDIIVKKIAEYLFNEWKQQKLDEGYHLPKCCPYYDKGNTDEDLVEDDIIHCRAPRNTHLFFYIFYFQFFFEKNIVKS